MAGPGFLIAIPPSIPGLLMCMVSTEAWNTKRVLSNIRHNNIKKQYGKYDMVNCSSHRNHCKSSLTHPLLMFIDIVENNNALHHPAYYVRRFNERKLEDNIVITCCH